MLHPIIKQLKRHRDHIDQALDALYKANESDPYTVADPLPVATKPTAKRKYTRRLPSVVGDEEPTTPRKKRRFSAKERAAIGARTRKYWADWRKRKRESTT